MSKEEKQKIVYLFSKLRRAKKLKPNNFNLFDLSFANIIGGEIKDEEIDISNIYSKDLLLIIQIRILCLFQIQIHANHFYLII